MSDPDNEVFVSVASCWEMAITLSLGKLRLAQRLDRFIPEQLARNGFSLSPVELSSLTCLGTIPGHRGGSGKVAPISGRYRGARPAGNHGSASLTLCTLNTYFLRSAA